MARLAKVTAQLPDEIRQMAEELNGLIALATRAGYGVHIEMHVIRALGLEEQPVLTVEVQKPF